MQIADGLSVAHSAGFAHRDLKPDNILATKDGRVKILDFGLAKKIVVPAESDATRTIPATEAGTVVGTVAYMSPEQARGQSLDGRSDQFSFGLILYELSAGKRAFERESAAETMTAIIREEPEPLPSTIPAPLRWTIARLLAKEPCERYDSTRDLYRDLRQTIEHLSEASTGGQAAVAPPPLKRSRGPMVLGGVACLIGGFLIAAFWPLPPPEPPKLTPFAAESDIQTMPAWSPKGDRIAYSSDVNGILQILTKKVGSSMPTQMTHQNESCFNPFWTADGTRIYYTSGTRVNSRLWLVAIAGGQAEKVLDGVLSATLSPDGKTLAVMAPESAGRYRLAFSSPPGARPQPCSRLGFSGIESSGNNFSFQFTPSGKYLGFSTGAADGPGFWRIALDGGPPEELAPGTMGRPRQFTWMRDGQRVIGNAASFSGGLMLSDLRTGTSHPLTMGVTWDEYPSLSPDGRTLAYDAGDQGYDVIEAPLDGSALRDVIATSRNEVAPAWAPDGAHFAYITNRNGVPEIWLRNRADGSERLIAGPKEFPGRVSFAFLDCAISPDGSRIAYRVVDPGQAIWISPLSGETPVRLREDAALQRGPSWSPDGNWIAYYSLRDGRPAVLKARVGSTAPPDLVTYFGFPSPVRWSPRGDWIAFDDDRKLRIVSPDGKQNRIVSQRQWETYGWSKDGASLYGVAINQDRRLILGRIDIATAKETKISDLGPAPSAAFDVGLSYGQFPFRGFSLHPDGKSFLTSIFRMKSQIYLMEGFDRPVRLIDRLWTRR